MVAGAVANTIAELMVDVDLDMAPEDELRDILMRFMDAMLETDTGKDLRNFSDKHVAKSTPWDGEKEDEFKSWTEKLVSFMAGAGDKRWRTIIKEIQKREEDD